ncbi:putative tRNA(His) guanylyltransferase [Hypsibius exemplaris]|uniref:tRNA(His) guanylyltransferase n=1 Tax=Hypsibius exemplaris TaxID=2072580 RepID=A0A1W0WH90_HYPEX|nr:putative tRNA(His) guanylyltransferase [Hypsibius exemplaris]
MFEKADVLLPKCWPVIRVDGRGFHRFSDSHGFKKPNDDRSLHLMTKAASKVMEDLKDVVLAYGQSDEYSFVLNRNTTLYNRRESKIVSTITSLFTSCFAFHWSEFFPTTPLQYPPAFDGRAVLYPTKRILRDYLCWRQADCHINNLYNTVFWALVQDAGMNKNDAQKRLKDTNAGGKNEILFSQFGVNYNTLPQLYRKGTVIIRPPPREPAPSGGAVERGDRDGTDEKVPVLLTLNEDIIRDNFWVSYPHVLEGEDE